MELRDSAPAIVECVPNVSEGRRPDVITRISEAIRRTGGVRLLHVDSGADANRTVFTFAGPPDAVGDVAFSMISEAIRLIDMRHHAGAHVRNGVVDVVPFVPIRGVDMDTCVALARTLADRVGRELQIPCYLYGEAATMPQRRALSFLRRGQYEALRDKLADPGWTPDAGPSEWTPRTASAGAVQIGARPFLIALNINLDTRDVRIARRIARAIRTSGVPGAGKRGLFDGLLADGWRMDAYGCTQVTMNVTDFRRAPLHEVFLTCTSLAQEEGTRVTGAELIGLTPQEALVAAGRGFLAAPDADEDTAVDVAVKRMGLSAVVPFNKEERIIDRLLAE
jgi:glutamate formiminotransferase/formiminotetrahydrofolate cyclodeaminase